ncbi:SH3 domain-containing protein [Acuticoccus kandeliae]|uniref:SH3 domain-containing protein n=1 Tax=Acuticoccus kandeliae TaxID=2073160 RepID=UPI00196B2C4F|nr:SH3 domain-containing protein [Acuticoccus kandeliae]
MMGGGFLRRIGGLAAGALLGLTLATSANALVVGKPIPSVATATVNLRAGPSTAYPVVVVVPVGAPVATHGCTSSYAWCDVSFGTYRGWVASAYITATHRGATVAVTAATAATVGIVVVGFSRAYWDTHYVAYPWYGRWAAYPPYVAPRVTGRTVSGGCVGGTCTRTGTVEGVYGGSASRSRTCGGGACETTKSVTGPAGYTGTASRQCGVGGCSVTRTGPRGATRTGVVSR